jgi:FkbM family methyltransferase
MKDLPPAESVEKFISCHGIKIPDYPGIIGRKIRRLLRAGTYEMREYTAVRALVGRDDVVLELGAGIGFMSTVAAKLCGAKSVQAVEANPALIPFIKSVHDANGVTNVTVTNALLAGRKSKPADFYVRKNVLESSMQPMPGDKDGKLVAVQKVAVHNINTVLKSLKPTVLICDIEGAEASLLPHADLGCLNIAIVELHPQWIGQSGVQAVFDVMHRFGLSYFPKRSNKKVVTFRKGW